MDKRTVPYDDEEFFRQYAQMPRSRQGLSAAGEWSQLRALLPELRGKAVLDLGCGYGWHCRLALERGAVRVLGIDASARMLEEASRQNAGPGIEYRLRSIEEYDYPEKAWDCVISNLALHYVRDLEEIFRRVWGTLRPGGVFLLNIEHPVYTAGVGQDWVYGPDGRPDHWPVDDYFRPGERMTRFLGCPVRKYHHTLTQILGGLLKSGFRLDAVEEAQPPREMMDLPGMADEFRRPMMLLVRGSREG